LEIHPKDGKSFLITLTEGERKLRLKLKGITPNKRAKTCGLEQKRTVLIMGSYGGSYYKQAFCGHSAEGRIDPRLGSTNCSRSFSSEASPHQLTSGCHLSLQVAGFVGSRVQNAVMFFCFAAFMVFRVLFVGFVLSLAISAL
jgi:hypothetical protein